MSKSARYSNSSYNRNNRRHIFLYFFYCSLTLMAAITSRMMSSTYAFTSRHATSLACRRRLLTTSSSSKRMMMTSSNADTRNDKQNDDDNNNLTIYQQRTNTLRSNSKLSLAPMMEYTDRHFRHLVRLLSDRTLLYTEMVAANAIAHEREAALSSLSIKNHQQQHPSYSSLLDAIAQSAEVGDKSFDPTYLLRFLGQGHNPEGASVLQLGGSDPDQLFLASKTIWEFNQLAAAQQQQQHNQQENSLNNNKSPPIFCDYTALNLNCGCPSPKVAGKGCFGAALMQDPHLVKQLTSAMYQGSQGTMPITVKCRIGTDEGYQFTREQYSSRSEEEEYQSLKKFIEIVASDGIVNDFQVHARIAVLGKNYSPADNRKVPPLRYHQVRRLAEEFPELNISLNGGVETLSEVKRELDECPELDGIMVGRGWMSNPWAFAMSDELLYTDERTTSGSNNLSPKKPKNRVEVLEAYGRHADYEEELWDPVKIRRFITKAASQLFSGEPNAKRYRIALDEIAGLPKKLMKKGPDAMQHQPPLSELILDAATKHLSEEVLHRTPKDSYEKILWDESQAEKRAILIAMGCNDEKMLQQEDDGREEKKTFVQEWQQIRKEDEMKL